MNFKIKYMENPIKTPYGEFLRTHDEDISSEYDNDITFVHYKYRINIRKFSDRTRFRCCDFIPLEKFPEALEAMIDCEKAVDYVKTYNLAEEIKQGV